MVPGSVWQAECLCVTLNRYFCISACALAWSVTLRKVRRPRAFKNGLPRMIFAPEREELTGDWRIFHNGELHV